MRTEPWRADATASSSDHPRLLSSYRIDDFDIAVDLSTRTAKPRGHFTRAQGTIALDLIDVTDSTGAIEIDLGSIRMEGEQPDQIAERSTTARHWLGASSGAGKSPAATFRLLEITRSSAPAPHLGRLQRHQKGDQKEAGEVRRLTLTVRGQLELNAIRVERIVPLLVDFHYAAEAVRGARPLRIEITTASDVVVPLVEHDIEPRDAEGRTRATDLSLIGSEVSPRARVSASLTAIPTE